MPRLSLLGLIRAALVGVSALAVATELPQPGIPSRLFPDLVVIVVAASAVLRGPAHGALVGLASGWVVDLLPPAGSPLGGAALLYAVAGASAGAFHRPGGRGPAFPLAALGSAAVVVRLGELVVAVLGDGVIDVPAAATRVTVTLAVGVILLPVIISLDHSLVRRRLA
jgi:rod shape-determining protein MreD